MKFRYCGQRFGRERVCHRVHFLWHPVNSATIHRLVRARQAECASCSGGSPTANARSERLAQARGEPEQGVPVETNAHPAEPLIQQCHGASKSHGGQICLHRCFVLKLRCPSLRLCSSCQIRGTTSPFTCSCSPCSLRRSRALDWSRRLAQQVRGKLPGLQPHGTLSAGNWLGGCRALPRRPVYSVKLHTPPALRPATFLLPTPLPIRPPARCALRVGVIKSASSPDDTGRWDSPWSACGVKTNSLTVFASSIFVLLSQQKTIASFAACNSKAASADPQPTGAYGSFTEALETARQLRQKILGEVWSYSRPPPDRPRPSLATEPPKWADRWDPPLPPTTEPPLAVPFVFVSALSGKSWGAWSPHRELLSAHGRTSSYDSGVMRVAASETSPTHQLNTPQLHGVAHSLVAAICARLQRSAWVYVPRRLPSHPLLAAAKGSAASRCCSPPRYRRPFGSASSQRVHVGGATAIEPDALCVLLTQETRCVAPPPLRQHGGTLCSGYSSVWISWAARLCASGDTIRASGEPTWKLPAAERTARCVPGRYALTRRLWWQLYFPEFGLSSQEAPRFPVKLFNFAASKVVPPLAFRALGCLKRMRPLEVAAASPKKWRRETATVPGALEGRGRRSSLLQPKNGQHPKPDSAGSHLLVAERAATGQRVTAGQYREARLHVARWRWQLHVALVPPRFGSVPSDGVRSRADPARADAGPSNPFSRLRERVAQSAQRGGLPSTRQRLQTLPTDDLMLFCHALPSQEALARRLVADGVDVPPPHVPQKAVFPRRVALECLQRIRCQQQTRERAGEQMSSTHGMDDDELSMLPPQIACALAPDVVDHYRLLGLYRDLKRMVGTRAEDLRAMGTYLPARTPCALVGGTLQSIFTAEMAQLTRERPGDQ